MSNYNEFMYTDTNGSRWREVKLSLRAAASDTPWRHLWEWLLSPDSVDAAGGSSSQPSDEPGVHPDNRDLSMEDQDER